MSEQGAPRRVTHTVDWDLVAVVAGALVVVITVLLILFFTAQRNSVVTEEMARQCISAGGTWLAGTSGGCVR